MQDLWPCEAAPAGAGEDPHWIWSKRRIVSETPVESSCILLSNVKHHCIGSDNVQTLYTSWAIGMLSEYSLLFFSSNFLCAMCSNHHVITCEAAWNPSLWSCWSSMSVCCSELVWWLYMTCPVWWTLETCFSLFYLGQSLFAWLLISK